MACSQLRDISFLDTQLALARFNARRLEPQFPVASWSDDIAADCEFLRLEGGFVEDLRRHVAPLVANVPVQPDAFIAWFEDLRETGPGQGDALFPWLATQASLSRSEERRVGKECA